jgi:hypothetical protein
MKTIFSVAKGKGREREKERKKGDYRGIIEWYRKST